MGPRDNKYLPDRGDGHPYHKAGTGATTSKETCSGPKTDVELLQSVKCTILEQGAGPQVALFFLRWQMFFFSGGRQSNYCNQIIAGPEPASSLAARHKKIAKKMGRGLQDHGQAGEGWVKNNTWLQKFITHTEN